MQLVFVAYGNADFGNRNPAALQKLCGFCHPVLNQKLLRRQTHGFLEQSSEITPVQPTCIGDILNGNIVLVIGIDISDCLFDIEIP